MKIQLLRTIYSGLLAGMPPFVYNPFTKNTLNVPFTVSKESAYLNFCLTDEQSDFFNDYINKNIKNSDNFLQIVPVQILKNENKHKYLSVNVYNCTSPVFMNDNVQTTRCEINTYVMDKNGIYGTVILDYLSNELSMDPINIFKGATNISYCKEGYQNIINCKSLKNEINIYLAFSKVKCSKKQISDDLIQYSDYIFYKNGIYDKLFYDSSLVKSSIKGPLMFIDLQFSYKDFTFENMDSMFYFEDNINFIGGMWSNIFYY
tara:strand:- start:28735 stop:29517 length:783 start_codon:yes stop_codon:yes gene_type:complete